jgi:hypothetical protein
LSENESSYAGPGIKTFIVVGNSKQVDQMVIVTFSGRSTLSTSDFQIIWICQATLELTVPLAQKNVPLANSSLS